MLIVTVELFLQEMVKHKKQINSSFEINGKNGLKIFIAIKNVFRISVINITQDK